MSADLLRKAASKMRERAKECRPVSWAQNGRNGVHTPIGQCVATTHSHDDAMRKAEAEHIASWHPAVALAVADWPEEAAGDLDRRQRNVDGLLTHIAGAQVQIDAEALEPAALAVARAFLAGGDR